LRMIDCEIKNCTSTTSAITTGTTFYGSGLYIHNNAGDAIRTTTSTTTVSLNECRLTANTGHGLNFLNTATASEIFIRHSTIANNGGSGLVTATNSSNVRLELIYNIFDTNGAWGINHGDAQVKADANVIFNRANAYRGNVSGARNNLSAGL